MLFRTLKKLIERGQTNGLAEKIDIFYATDKISKTEYEMLTAMLSV